VNFVIPDLDNDMHDGTVAAEDAWLQANMPMPVSSTPIATIFFGSSVRHAIAPKSVTLYSILRVIEEICGLPYIGEEAAAPSITGLWNRHRPS
jgi:phosphatidylinositol-3-phosphatase